MLRRWIRGRGTSWLAKTWDNMVKTAQNPIWETPSSCVMGEVWSSLTFICRGALLVTWSGKWQREFHYIRGNLRQHLKAQHDSCRRESLVNASYPLIHDCGVLYNHEKDSIWHGMLEIWGKFQNLMFWYDICYDTSLGPNHNTTNEKPEDTSTKPHSIYRYLIKIKQN